MAHASPRTWCRRHGLLAFQDGVPADASGWRAARSAFAYRRDKVVVITAGSFYRPDLGLPALCQWLTAHGCTHQRMGVLASEEEEDGE